MADLRMFYLIVV